MLSEQAVGDSGEWHLTPGVRRLNSERLPQWVENYPGTSPECSVEHELALPFLFDSFVELSAPLTHPFCDCSTGNESLTFVARCKFEFFQPVLRNG